MKTGKLLLAMILCSGMAFGYGLLGCGDDDDDGGDGRCEATCNKIIDCAADFQVPIPFSAQECTDDCKQDDSAEKDCALGCDTNLSCIEYANCIAVDCGIDFD